MPEVSVNEENPAALDGERDGQVKGKEGFSGARIEGGEHEDVLFRVLGRHELEIGPEYAEGLIGHIPAAILHDNELAFFLVAFEQMLLPILDIVLGTAKRHLTDERNGKGLEVLAAPDFGVGGLDEINDAERHGHSHDQGNEQYHSPVRGLRQPGACRRGYDSGIVCGEGLR